jgi:hypothetical protein
VIANPTTSRNAIESLIEAPVIFFVFADYRNLR